MSSRREEKQRRREERLAQERALAATQARRRRVRYVVAGASAAAVLAVAGVQGVQALEGDGPTSTSGASGTLPKQQTSDLKDAVKLAGCKLENTPNEGVGHEEKEFKASDYKSNPPTSGSHAPTWYEDGIYAPGDTPELGKLVHTLEHGRVNVQYRQGTPAATTGQLEDLLAEMDDGYHLLLHENTTAMPYAIAATAWDQRLGCPAINDRVFDAIRAFRTEYIDKGPEVVP